MTVADALCPELPIFVQKILGCFYRGSPTYAVFTTADPTTAIFGKLYVIKVDTFCMVKSEQFKPNLGLPLCK